MEKNKSFDLKELKNEKKRIEKQQLLKVKQLQKTIDGYAELAYKYGQVVTRIDVLEAWKGMKNEAK